MEVVKSFGASQDKEVNEEAVIGQLNPHKVTEFYYLVVSNPVPVNVKVAPPA